MTDYISHEWAKQLVFNTYGTDLDFYNMKATKVHDGILYLRVPLIDCKIEQIEIQKYYDPINREYTYLGYGHKSNMIAIGRTTPSDN